jgi:hypothetical protein
MDLIFTNPSREDVGILQDYELDLAFGSDENNFECTIPAQNHCCEDGSLLYIEGTEYGGIVDGIESKTDSKEVIYSGRTWHGLLGSKIILPLQGNELESEISQTGSTLCISFGVSVIQEEDALYIQDIADVTIKETNSAGESLIKRHLILSGDANECIRFLLDRCGLSNTFCVPFELSGININSYQFTRFTDVYTGISKMLATANARLLVSFQKGRVVLSAVPRDDYSADEEFDSDLLDFTAKKKYRTVNHLICLGPGELENRTVIHLYADTDGNISQTQTQKGLNEYVDVFDYPNAESTDELILAGTETLKNLREPDKLTVDFDDTSDRYHVGDKVGATDSITGLSVSATITKKIVTIKNGQITISYKVGD